MQVTVTSLNWLFRQFGRASMLARLSMLINIVLMWGVYNIHLNEDMLRREVIECHSMRFEDYKRIIAEQNSMKSQIKANEEKISENKEEIQKIK